MAFDPSELSLTGWWRGYPGSASWSGTSSAGTSGSASLAHNGTDPSVGATLNGLATADFNGANQSLVTSVNYNTSLISNSAGTILALFNADTAPADPGAASPHTLPGFLNCTTGDFGFGITTSGVRGGYWNGLDWNSALARCTVGSWALAQMKWDGVNLQVRVNNGPWSTLSRGAASLTTAQGIVGPSFNSAALYDGRIAELMTAQSALPDATLTNIGLYLQSRYALDLGFENSTRLGVFSKELSAYEWFDSLLVPSAWFDEINAPPPGQVVATLGAATLAATGEGPKSLVLTQSLGDATAAATGTVPTSPITFSNAGATSAALAPTYPSGIAAGDMLLLGITNKYPTNGPSTPSGWTLLAQSSGGHGTSGPDAGSVYCTVFYKIADGTETGTLSLAITGVNSSVARIYHYVASNSPGSAILTPVATTGAENSATASWSVAGGADPGFQTGDRALVFAAVNTDTYTYDSESISATGVTFGSLIERQDFSTAGGDDSGQVLAEFPVVSGTSSGVPTFTMSASAAAGTDSPAGAVVFVRLRLTAITGTTSQTLGAASVASTGTTPEFGTLSQTLAAATVAATGTTPEFGTLSKTLGALTVSATGTSPEFGTLAQTLGTLALSATGTTPEFGTLSKTLAAATLAATGTTPAFGSLTTTLGAVTVSATGTAPAVGSLSQTLGAVALVATGNEPEIATLSATLANVTLSSTGTAPAVGSLSATLGAATLSAAGTTPEVGSLGATLDALALSASGHVSGSGITGTLAQTLADASMSASGTCPAVASGVATLGGVGLSATGSVPSIGALSKALQGVSLTAAGTTPEVAALSVLLADAALLSSGSVVTPAISGALTATLGPAAVQASGRVRVTGALAATLGVVTVLADGVIVTTYVSPLPRIPADGSVAQASAHDVTTEVIGSSSVSGVSKPHTDPSIPANATPPHVDPSTEVTRGASSVTSTGSPHT